MEPYSAVVILITASTAEEARKMADLLLQRRKAACVSIVPRVESRFWWQGKLDAAAESLLVVKTRASALDEVIKCVKEVHSYQVPEIIALPVIGGNKDYLEWIAREVQ